VVIVMLTTSVKPRDLERLRSLPVAKFLPKPLTAEKVSQLLAHHFPAPVAP
jgi:CheY-like chemotaxis protein